MFLYSNNKEIQWDLNSAFRGPVSLTKTVFSEIILQTIKLGVLPRSAKCLIGSFPYDFSQIILSIAFRELKKKSARFMNNGAVSEFCIRFCIRIRSSVLDLAIKTAVIADIADLQKSSHKA